MIRQRSVCTFWQVLVMTAPLAGGWGAERERSGCVVAGSARFAEQAGECGDGFEQQRVEAGLLVGGAAGVELGGGATVFGLGGELAHPGGGGGAEGGRRVAGRGAGSAGCDRRGLAWRSGHQ